MNLLLHSPSNIVNPLARQRFMGFGTGSSGGPSFVGPLDNYTTSLAAAWSISRRLLASYTGPLIRIRRSSDSTEQDIGATALGDLDTAAITSFVGSNSAFVRTVYHQNSGANLEQATAASQPQIVNAGTLETVNGKPACLFSGHFLQAAVSGGGAAAWTNYMAASVAANIPGQSFARLLAAGASGVNDWTNVNSFVGFARVVTGTTYNVQFNGTSSAAVTLANGSNLIAASRFQASNPVRYLKVNAASAITENTAATPNFTFTTMRVGRGVSSTDAGEYFTGKMSEVVCYSTAHADPTILMGVMNTYFGLY
jgi:hypothetical protein